jgi:hypothetical protein
MSGQNVLAELRELLSEATKGPWTQWQGSGAIFAGEVKKNVPGMITGGYRITEFDPDNYDDADSADPEGQALTDAALVVALVNVAPELLEIADAACAWADDIEGDGASNDQRLLNAVRALRARVRR